MRGIAIDFARPVKASRLAAYLLAGMGALALLAAGLAYAAYSSELASWEQEREELAARQPDRARQPSAPLDENAKALAQEAGRLRASLEAPWEAVFGALEAVPAQQVAVLNLALDGESRELNLAGEAQDAAAMHGYVRGIGEATGLTGAYLASHEVNIQHPRHPLRFALGASWRALAPQARGSGGGAP